MISEIKKNNKKRILAFGTIPRHLGGKVSSGLALVMWNLASKINDDSIEVSYAATDLYLEKKIIDNVAVYGWTFQSVLNYIFIHPFVTLKLVYVALILCVRFKLNPLRSFIYLTFFNKTIHELNPDIIHIHGTNYIYFHYLNLGTKIFITIHGLNGLDGNIKNFKQQRHIEKIMSVVAFSKIIFVSNDLKDQWINTYGINSEYRVIHNAYDDRYFYYKETRKENNDKIILTSVGRVYPLKGQDRIIQSISLADKDRFEYRIIGEGEKEYITNLQNLAKSLKVSVKFYGMLSPSEIAEILRESNYMILASSSEGFGIAFIESIACGTKIIIPQNLPLSKEEKICTKINSIFLDDCSVQSITQCLNTLRLSDHYLRSEVSQSIMHLNWSEITQEYKLVIDSI